MNNLSTLLKKELLEQLRTKKILILAIVFLFVAVSSPILAKLTPELLKSVAVPGMTLSLPDPTYVDSVDQFIKNISQITLLVLVFVVAGAVVDEKNKRTLEMVLSKPVSKPQFIIAKYASYFITISLAYWAASIIFYVYTISLLGEFSLGHFLIMASAVWLYILMIVSITILASAYVKNLIAAAGIGFVSYILFGTIAGLFKDIERVSPNYIFAHYREIIENGWTNDLLLPYITVLIIIALSIITAVNLFKQQEIER